MKYFIPITDKLLYDGPEEIFDELVPYHTDYQCYRWLIDDTFLTAKGIRKPQTKPEAKGQD